MLGQQCDFLLCSGWYASCIHAGGLSCFEYISGLCLGCPVPEELDNATMTVSDKSYSFGSNITYTCNECYTGGGVSMCEDNATWSSVPECISK